MLLRSLALLLFCVGMADALVLNEHQAQGSGYDANDEYLDADSLRVLGELPIITTLSDIVDVLGPPDSTIVFDRYEQCPNYFYRYCPESYEHALWNETEVELCVERAVFRLLSFENDPELFVTYPGGLRLSAETTPADVGAFFPGAAERLHEVAVYEKGTYDRVSLAAEPPPAESAWMLFFSEGNLAFMNYWFPC